MAGVTTVIRARLPSVLRLTSNLPVSAIRPILVRALEFFIFDSVEWHVDMSGCNLKIYSQEAAWASGEKTEGGGGPGQPTVKGGYFPVPPVDSLHDIRSAMVLTPNYRLP